VGSRSGTGCTEYNYKRLVDLVQAAQSKITSG
jgi:hypothetical protein